MVEKILEIVNIDEFKEVRKFFGNLPKHTCAILRQSKYPLVTVVEFKPCKDVVIKQQQEKKIEIKSILKGDD